MRPELYLLIMCILCFATVIISWSVNRSRAREELSNAIKQDITSEQMQAAEERVTAFFRENNLRPGVPILQIGQVLKIHPSEFGEPVSGQAHLSEPDENGTMFVTFRKGLTPQERQFAFAHECGHVLNKDTVPIDRPTGRHKDPAEQAADYVAAALLMPLDDVYNYLSENCYKDVSSRQRVKLIRRLCQRYGVSNVIAVRRIREVYMLKEAG